MATLRDNKPAVITAENTFTPWLQVAAGDLVSLSAFRTAFTGTYTLQRRIDGVNARDVTKEDGTPEQWTGVDLETSYQVDVSGDVRIGVKTGDFAGTSLALELRVG